MNFLMEELSISDSENVLLKAKGQFNCQQANNTMKRFAGIDQVSLTPIKK